MGFAQTVQRDLETVELDRIVVFPEFTGRGIGTQLLARVIKDQKCKKAKTMMVNVGKGETHARLFYEKNGCELTKEYMMNAPWGGKIALVTYQLRLKT